MKGPVHIIATNYCPLSDEEKLVNQQKFCTGCPNHDKCEERAAETFEAIKKTYLEPYEKVIKLADQTFKTFENLKKMGDSLKGRLKKE